MDNYLITWTIFQKNKKFFQKNVNVKMFFLEIDGKNNEKSTIYFCDLTITNLFFVNICKKTVRIKATRYKSHGEFHKNRLIRNFQLCK